MKIQIGEVYMGKIIQDDIEIRVPSLYPNKTRKYLLPCLKEYGDEFMFRINNVFKIAAGVADIVTDNCGFTHEKHIFMLLDSKVASSFFIGFLDWIKEQEMYEDDYVFGNIQKSTYHMVVIRLPEKFWGSLDDFKDGSYSRMYSAETIQKFFREYPDVIKVFIKEHNYKINFVTKTLNRKFGTNLTHQDAEDWDGEVELKPDDKEIFNHHLKKKDNGTNSK